MTYKEPKNIIILSKNDYLYSSLSQLNFLPHALIHIDSKELFQQYKKSDITIIDLWSGDAEFIIPFSKYVISFHPYSQAHSNLLFKKPIIIEELINEIHKCLLNDKLFAVINDDIIYDEVNARISNVRNVVKLSTKENILIKELLLAENFYLSREFILGSIWKYSSKSETNTIESHIHKLRSKVPYFNIQPSNEGYRLNIEKML